MIKVNKLISVFLGLVMIIAFFGKGIALEEFEIEIKTMLIPFLSAITGVPSERQAIIKEVGMFILPLVLLILLIESLIGLFLLFEVQVRASALSLVLLLLTFTLVLIVNILYPSSELKTCGCFGVLWEEPITWWERVKKYSANRNGVDCISCRNEQRVKPTRSNKPKQQTEDESSWKEGKKQVR